MTGTFLIGISLRGILSSDAGSGSVSGDIAQGGYAMNVKGWAIPAGVGAAAGAVAGLMMPRTNPNSRLAAKVGNKMEDVAWKVSDAVSDKI